MRNFKIKNRYVEQTKGHFRCVVVTFQKTKNDRHKRSNVDYKINNHTVNKRNR